MSEDMPSKVKLRVIAPNKILVETEVDEVELPSLDGYLGILPGHKPLNTAIGEGEITFRQGEKKESFSVRGGFAEITPHSVLVITESGEERVERTFEE